MAENRPLFEEVCSSDHLGFSFAGRSYKAQLLEAVKKTKKFCGVSVDERALPSGIRVVWCQHDFGFIGGSLGCAEGEKLARAFEHATAQRLPIVVACRTGGARMQEGTMSLMQMAKVSVAVDAHRRAALPFLSVLEDPTYGGVSASYAMQADVRIAVTKARIGFAGPDVILNTMFAMDQDKYDAECPADFQSAEYCQANGQVDYVVTPAEGEAAADAVAKVCGVLASALAPPPTGVPRAVPTIAAPPPTAEELARPANYQLSRSMTRPQALDVIEALFTDYTELKGDGRVATDFCIKGGVARLRGSLPCVVLGCMKGHSPGEMQAHNYGMPSPAGYRTAHRLFQLAERFSLPVVTLVDTVGAWPSFPAEQAGQSEAIATNLTLMAGLKTPIVTVVIGEGGSGGALGVAMGNVVGMLSNAYYGVISPEGAASILGRYKGEAHKAEQFPKDAAALATAQCIYAHQLKEMNVIDEVIYEDVAETNAAFPTTAARIGAFVCASLARLSALGADALVQQRYDKFRAIGAFQSLGAAEKAAWLAEAEAGAATKPRPAKPDVTPCKLIKFLAHEVLRGERSRFKGLAPPSVALAPPTPPGAASPPPETTAKAVLDAEGPEAMAQWVRAQPQVLLTDTTMRDAHQSLLATRVRTIDLVKGAAVASKLLSKAFSFECWGGATFDVAYRFLYEDPWDRLRAISAAAPNVCTQMLIRGANAVGYTSYHDTVVEKFVELAARNGMDVFRIFDCFNDVGQMQVAIDAVRKARKVAEVCICYTADVLTSSIYDMAYYRDLAAKCVAAGAHVIGIKDMAGLLKPLAAKPLMRAIREVCPNLPVHFHTHCTSSASLAVALEMSKAGCDIIDFAIASMADLTSQPSLNAFCAAMAGDERDPGIDYMTLEPLDIYWMQVREMYAPFETGMLAGSARVFDHEIPGGQYANLYVQCKSMGLADQWAAVLDMYRDVNQLFGDVVKVTPSSKCVGDLALFLINKGMRAADVVDPVRGAIDYPDSVIGLMEGRLGFPHRGFPKAVQDAVLAKAGTTPLTTSPSAALPPADFVGATEALSAKWALPIDEERCMASFMYPKVFDDFMKYCKENTSISVYLPTPVFFYSFALGQTATLEGLPAALAKAELDIETDQPCIDVPITLKRVGPLKRGKLRTIVFDVAGAAQHVEVKDVAGADEFDGPIADAADPTHQIAAPMPGAVAAVLVAPGAPVAEGDDLFVISAMKMEVKVKAPAGVTKVGAIAVSEGAKVIEGALLCKLA